MTKLLKTNISILRSERETELETIKICIKRRKLEVHCKIENLKDELRKTEYEIRQEIKQKMVMQLEFLRTNKVTGRTKLIREIIIEKKLQLQLSKERLKQGLDKLREQSRKEKSDIESIEYLNSKQVRSAFKDRIKTMRNNSKSAIHT